MYEFSGQMSEEDFIDYNIFHMENSKVMKNTTRGLWLVFPIGFFCFGWISGRELDIVFWLILIIGTIGMALWIPSMMKRSVNKRVAAMLKESKNGEMFTEKKFIVDDKGVTVESESSNSFYKWESIMKLDESETTFYIYVSSVQAIIINKRHVGDSKEIEAFKAYLESHIS